MGPFCFRKRHYSRKCQKNFSVLHCNACATLSFDVTAPLDIYFKICSKKFNSMQRKHKKTWVYNNITLFINVILYWLHSLGREGNFAVNIPRGRHFLKCHKIEPFLRNGIFILYKILLLEKLC